MSNLKLNKTFNEIAKFNFLAFCFSFMLILFYILCFKNLEGHVTE